jgi:hypothetical protein
MEGLGNPPRFKEFPRTGPGEGALRVVGDMEVRWLVRVTLPNEPLADSCSDFNFAYSRLACFAKRMSGSASNLISLLRGPRIVRPYEVN